MESKKKREVSGAVRNWLMLGIAMVFVQVVVGGVTRLTDSGLSITEWAVIQGTIPPLNESEWQEAFEQYREAAKRQYESLHADMSLSSFKVIYFWEYAHRLWARLMGLVFLFPFLYFLWRRLLPGWLLRRLAVVVALAALAATFGWIMVASGLNKDNRTWVSAYKLVVHLGIAFVLFGYLYWTWLMTAPGTLVAEQQQGRWWMKVRWVVFWLLVQVLFGGLMAGMRAGLIFTHYPLWLEWRQFVALFGEGSLPAASQVLDYESSLVVKAVVQLLHRVTAWVLLAVMLMFARAAWREQVSDTLKAAIRRMLWVLGVQLLIGVLTVTNSIGRIPVGWGAIHQAVALVLFATALSVAYHCFPRARTI
ncbi:MAG: hypothetical protein RLY31_1808 [Bacteroidota bacterium]